MNYILFTAGASPKSEPIDVEGGRVLLPYSLPPRHRLEISPFFKLIEESAGPSGMITDYSITQTTLEEVFMNVRVFEMCRYCTGVAFVGVV